MHTHAHTSSLPPTFSQDEQHYQASAADGEIGLFSAAAILERPPVPMLPMPWFHGAISRLDAEKLLDRNQDGQFLLRASQNTQGVYALAVRLDLMVWLARIGCVMSWLCTHTSWEQIYVPLTVEWIGSLGRHLLIELCHWWHMEHYQVGWITRSTSELWCHVKESHMKSTSIQSIGKLCQPSSNDGLLGTKDSMDAITKYNTVTYCPIWPIRSLHSVHWQEVKTAS